jgi:phosphatidate phosphatase APP1
MSLFRNKTHKAEKSFDTIKLKIKDALNLFDPVIIFPYRGYGTGERFFIEGRVLEKEDVIHGEQEHSNSLWNNIHKIWKRYESDEIPGVGIEAEMEGIIAKTVSNEEGFFKLVFNVPAGIKLTDGWHKALLQITEMPYDVEFEKTATADVLISNQQNCFGIVSDVDDTIIKSSAMNTIKKLRIMLTQNARNRAAFPGVEMLYHKLCNNGKNPLFFVSGSSWNLYDMLVDFCEHQNLPKAPFFLRNLGLSPEQWLKQDTSPYKKEYITHILKVFNRLSFILIGDSGQKDPEIYTEIYNEFPGRIKAIYIRHVHTDNRKTELEQMAEAMDIPFLILTDSQKAWEHASQMKWI